MRDDGKRPDGLTLIPFEQGRSLIWDGTVTDTLTPSSVSHGSCRASWAATQAETAKLRKYQKLQQAYVFFPLAFETLGGPGPRTKQLLDKVGDLLERSTGDPRSGEFLRQRLSLDIQRGNAASVLGTLARWRGPGLFDTW